MTNKKTNIDSGRYCSRAAVMLAAGLWLAGCSDEPKAPMQPGEADYARYCAACHARDGAGRPPTFPPLAGSEWLEMGPEAVTLVVMLGLRGEIEVAGNTYRGYMPAMRQIDDTEMTGILDYINAQWADWDGALDTDGVARLRGLAADEELLEGRAALERVLERLAP